MVSFSEISQLIKAGNKLTTQIKNRELNEILLQYQAMMMDMNSEIADLKQKLSEYETKRVIESSLTIEDDLLKIHSDSNRYCTRCWGKERKLNMVSISRDGERLAAWCPVCNFTADLRETSDVKINSK